MKDLKSSKVVVMLSGIFVPSLLQASGLSLGVIGV